MPSQTPGVTATAISVEAATSVLATLQTETPLATATVESPTAEPDQAAPDPRATLALVIKTPVIPSATPRPPASISPTSLPPVAELPTLPPETAPSQTPSATITAISVEAATNVIATLPSETPLARTTVESRLPKIRPHQFREQPLRLSSRRKSHPAPRRDRQLPFRPHLCRRLLKHHHSRRRPSPVRRPARS